MLRIHSFKLLKRAFVLMLCFGLLLLTPANHTSPAIADPEPAPTEAPTYTATVSPGRYAIISALNADLALDVASSSTKNKANVEVDDRSMGASQRWDLTFDNHNGTYRVRDVKSGKYLAVATSSMRNSTNVRQESKATTLRQQWLILESSADGYNIVSASNPNYALKVAGAKKADHTNVQVYKKSTSAAAQRFRFVKVAAGLPSNGYYKIKSANGYQLDVASGSLDAKAKVRLGAKTSKAHRKWYLSYTGGHVTLLNAPSYLALSVNGNSKANGAKVVQATAKKLSGQKYRLIPTDTPKAYYLQNAAGLFLSYGANDKAGTNITVTRDIANAGLWHFVRTTYSDAKVKPGTYVDIDISSQMVRFVKNGKIVYSTKCVTGNVSAGSSTPLGKFTIKNKTRNTVLRGPGYASPVRYWMPYNGEVGMHDANWRRAFGGKIYKTGGSHGCVNIPPSRMAELYKLSKVGTRVVVHK